ncbi:8614_t:CDS:2 [Ambispora gerdemannii]|uniref:8614_t:CDS:1 n=1 Tax=Ambispora gerdemannii TaxID=144530 RepID=A0A9N9D9Q6_9GLOM|nr:8614_t:CDS:2 [Ambispora gerdemannii]
MSQNRCIRCNKCVGEDSWCNDCDIEQLMKGWTSGNKEYDAVIQQTQKSADSHNYPCLKWIPSQSLINLVEIRRGNFGTIYSADWVNGRGGVHWRETIKVAVRVLNCSADVDTRFLQELEKGAATIQNMSNPIYQVLGLFGVTKFNDQNKYALVAGTFATIVVVYLTILPGVMNVNSISILQGGQSLKNLVTISNSNAGTTYSADWVEGEYDGWTVDKNRQIAHQWKTVKVTFSVLNCGVEFLPDPRIIRYWCDEAQFFHVDDDDARFMHELFKGLGVIFRYIGEHNQEDFDGWRFCDYELKALKKFKIKRDDESHMGVQVVGVSKNNENQFLLVMNYAEGSDLRKYLKNNPHISWANRLSILYDITLSLLHIHEAGIIHRDIHGGNILISRSGSGNFGRAINKGQIEPSNAIIGVLPYIAPEILRQQIYTQAQDIYSLGVIMSQISTGQFPLPKREYGGILMLEICDGLRPHFEEGTPQIDIDFAKRCMHDDPEKRPTAKEASEKIERWLFTEGASSHGLILRIYDNSFMAIEMDPEIKKLFQKADKKRPFPQLDQKSVIPCTTRYHSSVYSLQELQEKFLTPANRALESGVSYQPNKRELDDKDAENIYMTNEHEIDIDLA